MKKRLLPLTKVSFGALRDWPLANKLLLLVLVPMGIALIVTLSLTLSGLNRLEADTSTSTLQGEVQIISQRFVDQQANLQTSVAQLTADPLFLDAIERNDQAVLQGNLLSASTRSGFNHLQILNTNGRTLSVIQSIDLTEASSDLEQLNKLGLLEIEAMRLLSTPHGWLLTIVRPIKSPSGLVGVLSAGRLLDASTLAEINFERTNPRLVVFDTQGKINAVAKSEAPGSLEDVFTVDHNLWTQALAGQTVLSQARIQGELQRVAYAPLTIGDQPVAVFSLSLSTATATNMRNQLIITDLLASGALALLTIFSVLLLGRNLISKPIAALVAGAKQVEAGKLDVVIPGAANRDEIGALAGAFNNMTSRLRELIGSLEQGTQSLQLAAKVGRAVSQVRALDVMLRDACELIRKEFDLYYVQVYLTDTRQATLQLRAGTGEIGTQLLEQRHRLQINTDSINGRAALEKRTVIVSNTTESATFRSNPLLPDTCSEMAMPLIVGEKVAGVLDMQSSVPGALNEEVLPVFEALAGQLAVAIQNATLVAEAQEARAEVEAQARRLVRAGWDEYLDAIHKPENVGFVFDHDEVVPLDEADELPDESRAVSAPISLTGEVLGSLVVELEDEAKSEQTVELVDIVARQVAQQIENLRLLDSAERYRYEAEQAARRQTREGWQEYVKTKTDVDLGYLYDLNEVRPYNNGKNDASALTLPLKVRDEAIGKLSVQGITPDDRELVELANAVAERLGAHIENLRQYNRTQSALAQSEKLFDASRSLTQATDLQELVAATVNTLGIPEVNRAVLTTFGYDSAGEIEQLTIIANWWNEAGHEVTPVGTRYPLEVIRAMPMFVSPTPGFLNDTFDDERVDATTMELVKKLNLRALAVLPLHTGTQQIGALIMEAEEPHNFTPDETRLFESLAPQIATVLENRQQYEKAQRQAEREAMLNAISQKIQSATSVEAVLQIAARELGHALGAPMTIAQLSMKDQN
ncbi:MAG: GAF domain-containing protein [Anaerolineales bacterium]|nr:GAF domain-containing protein [Anaerolineales bacterium]